MVIWKVEQNMNGDRCTVLCDNVSDVIAHINFLLEEYATCPSGQLSFGISRIEMPEDDFDATPEYEGE